MVTYLQGNGTPGPSPSPTAEEIDAALLGKLAKKKQEEKKSVVEEPKPAVVEEPKAETTTRVMAAEPSVSRSTYRTRTVKADTKDSDA